MKQKHTYCYEINVNCAECNKPLKIITYDESNDNEYYCQRCITLDMGSNDDD